MSASLRAAFPLRHFLPLSRTVTKTLLYAAMAASFVDCSEGETSLEPQGDSLAPVKGMMISNPNEAASGSLDQHWALRVASTVVYVSAAPNTLPDAVKVQIDNRTQKSVGALVAVVNGGFDPVAIGAAAGDTLDITAWNENGTKDPMVVKVPAKKPPAVVRSNPPKGRTDVALNVVVAIVFSEPIDKSTVTSASVHLLKDGRAVSGHIRFTSDPWDVEFVPDQPLTPNTGYEVVVLRDVRDVSGDAIDAVFNAAFTSGTDPCGGSSAPPNCVPRSSGTNVISGIVRERLSDGSLRPLANVQISAWLRADDGQGYALEQIASDESGRYNIGPVENGLIQLHASVPGMNQPCGTSLVLTGSGGSGNIELVANSSPSVEREVTIPRLVGLVYELVPVPNTQLEVRPEPVPSAQIYLESPVGFVAATTIATSSGRYALCNLPTGPSALYVAKSSFELFQRAFIVGAANSTFDIELTRAR